MGSDRDSRYKTQAWRRVRRAVLIRDGQLCQLRLPGCTVDAPLNGGHVDHIVSPRDGGAFFDQRNLRAACPDCNRRDGGHRSHGTTYPGPSRAWR